MRRLYTAALASVLLTAGLPVQAQVAPPGPSNAGAAARVGAGGVPRGANVPVPGTPRWGGGSPPPGPFDRLPGVRAPLPRPGVDAFRATAGTYAPNFSASPRGRGGQPTGNGPRDGRRRYNRGIVYPQFGAVYYGGAPFFYYPGPYYPGQTAPLTQPSGSAEPVPAGGFLRLIVTPRQAGVFIDGIYEGTVDDFGGTGERVLSAGIHSVRIEAEGFDPVAFDVRVPENDTITLRRDLEPRRTPPSAPPARAPAASAPSATPKTIYVIPRCYLGDSRPQPNQLPAGCSITDLQTLP